MKDSDALTFPTMFSKMAEANSGSGALTFVDEEPLSYSEIYSRTQAVIGLLEKMEIEQGDKVAILSTNMPNWGISYFAITFMGAVAVPLLPDFIEGEIENILNHSESKAIFVSESLLSKIENFSCPKLRQKIGIEDFAILNNNNKQPEFSLTGRPEKKYFVKENDLAAIIYTSGTTGSSKGVMLTHKNICHNILACRKLQKVDEKDRFLSLLPLSHTLENTVGFLVPLFNGACVYYLRKPPSPTVLMEALQKVRPTIVLSVPMVIEKIYYNRIQPALYGKAHMRALMRVKAVQKILHRAAGKKLMKTFGGSVVFFGIGGAKLNRTVEVFLHNARFPYAIGYGLTETAPMLAGAVPGKVKLESTGPAVEGVTLQINDPDPVSGEGEIWAKGPNIMQGYYKEPELTQKVMTPDGWFKTGDLGQFDADQHLYIKGRLKNMIVGSSGENIYPEEIESVINNFKHVVESLVVERKGKLVALVHMNKEEIEQAYVHLKEEISHFVEMKTDEMLAELKKYVNDRVNKFSQLHGIVFQPLPFQKTATQKIKRYLYS